MFDQRGTGRSTSYGDPGPDAVADAERLTHFHADAIVRDAECLPEHLAPGDGVWSTSPSADFVRCITCASHRRVFERRFPLVST
jgi:hypothetical protein